MPDPAPARLPCTVRPPEPRDCARMAELSAQLGYPCSAADIAARIRSMADPSRYAVFVAEAPEAAGGVVGWIGVYIFRALEVEPFAEISGLVVDERRRSRGVGAQLLEAAAAWARARQCAVLGVRSNIIRADAHRFYERHGFEPVKTQKALRKIL